MLYVFFGIEVLLIFDLCWTSNPRLGLRGISPNWLTDCADIDENETIRTRIPFLLLGLVTGFRLIYLRSSFLKLLRYWVILVLIVILAELDQMLLPQRTSDWRDVAWGIIGTVLGLLIIAIIMGIRYLLNYPIQLIRK